MILFKLTRDIKNYLEAERKKNCSIGFVPTMGALHDGHFSLIKQCKKKTDIVVSSIFINPVQFNNPEDFKKYPSTLEKDILLLEENRCDIVFIPSVEEIYPDETSKHKHFELGYLEKVLEGKFRPGHFQGVCIVVEKLLNIVDPDILFLGQKDYQQCLVIKKLIRLMNKKIKVIISPIVREKNGLAMSSRNLRLSETEKEKAAQLYKTLQYVKKQLEHKNFIELKNNTVKKLEQGGFKVDYLELTDKDIKTTAAHHPSNDLILLIAAYLNGVRLIDNILIKNKY